MLPRRYATKPIISTNAPTVRFIERLASTYRKIGSVVIVRNDQDGSRAFSADIADRPEPKIDLRHQAAGIQAVRLMRRAPLSTIISHPMPGYLLATTMIAMRVRAFANQLATASVVDQTKVAVLHAGSNSMPGLMYAISQPSDATDERIERNVALRDAHRALLAKELTDTEMLEAATTYRAACATWSAP